ncbi:MAG: L-threonylcarbamoyladenylate synthase [Porphyromonadaceae bacterium]|nr:L-threonylcarbamoyladenylate synthase [Porphyromonadaceae bacterium]
MSKVKERPTYQGDIEAAVEIMRRGGVILYPTDTVWGIGCDATNPEAVARIYEIKRRADAKSMLVLVDSLAALEGVIPDVPEVAYDIIELAIRPVTIIYDSARGIAPNLLAEDGSLGVRLSKEAFSSALARQMRAPIVSTSANISGEPTPMVFSAISQEIIDAVDYVVGYRQKDTKTSPPSQIIKLSSKGEVKIIRP